MPWDDEDLKLWIEENLGLHTREEEITAALEARQWKQYQNKFPNDIDGHVRCNACSIPTAPRYLSVNGICFRCRHPEDRKAEIEKKLKNLFWFLKEIKRLRTCVKNWEAQNPDMAEIIKKLLP